MKKLRVTLNNRVYEVLVEVLEDDEARYPGSAAPIPPPAVIPAASATYAPPASAAPRSVPMPAPGAAGQGVFAPIVGTVTKILVAPGAVVKHNQPLIILDAMKMDTYINSPRDGVIGAIECKVGDSVQVGQKLVAFQ
jgi:biotin carboxyl carrier protein